MTHKTTLILNSISLVLVFIVNGLAGSGAAFGDSVGSVSADLDNLFTPAGYAFSIWGLIYLGLAVFLVFQWYALVKQKNLDVLDATGNLFLIANTANISWILLWISERPGLALLVMLVLLATLVALMFALRLETWDAPFSIIGLVWWPWTIYLGWIVVATAANVSAWLTSLGWKGGPLSESTWAMVVLGVATLVYLLLIYTRNMREAALVGVWAFVAIAVKRFDSHPEVATAAFVASAILILAAGVHGYLNRRTNPLAKLMG